MKTQWISNDQDILKHGFLSENKGVCRIKFPMQSFIYKKKKIFIFFSWRGANIKNSWKGNLLLKECCKVRIKTPDQFTEHLRKCIVNLDQVYINLVQHAEIWWLGQRRVFSRVFKLKLNCRNHLQERVSQWVVCVLGCGRSIETRLHMNSNTWAFRTRNHSATWENWHTQAMVLVVNQLDSFKRKMSLEKSGC